MPFSFEDTLGSTGVLSRTDDARVRPQRAVGTLSRLEYDAMEIMRAEAAKQSVDVVGSTAVPCLRITAGVEGPAACYEAGGSAVAAGSSRGDDGRDDGGAVRNVEPRVSDRPGWRGCGWPAAVQCSSSTACDIEASSIGSVYWDFARDDIAPRRSLHPTALEWTAVAEVPDVAGQLDVVYSFNQKPDVHTPSSSMPHGVHIHGQVEPIRRLSRIEWDYDVCERVLESSVELGPCGGASCRVDVRQDAVLRTSLKKAHKKGVEGLSGSVSSLSYSQDTGALKLELFKRKRAKACGSEGSDSMDTTKSSGLSVPTLRCTLDGMWASRVPLTSPLTSSLTSPLTSSPSSSSAAPAPASSVLSSSPARSWGRLRQIGIKHWMHGNRIDVHASLKKTQKHEDVVTLGAGGPRRACRVSWTRGGPLGSMTFTSKDALTSKVSVSRANGVMTTTVTCGGTIGERIKVKVRGEWNRSIFPGQLHAAGFVSL